jgi:uncharacterized membrane protein (DUF485 family)
MPAKALEAAMPAMSDHLDDEGHIARSLEVQASPDFQHLRRTFRRWVFPMTGAFLAWYFLYVLLSTYAHDFMSRSVIGNVHLGLVFGLLQFASTFAVTMAYARWADTKLDAERARLREIVEGGTGPVRASTEVDR